MPKSAPNFDIATRASVVSLKAPAGGGLPSSQITEILNISVRSINRIYSRAISRGFNPEQRPLSICNLYIEDAPRSGRPPKRTSSIIETVIAAVRTDRYGREKSCDLLAYEMQQRGIPISGSTVWRILKVAGFRKTKPTIKPGLSQAMKDARLDWCLQHQHWTIDDWKRVIFSDETSVVLGHRRGGYRVWRQADERHAKSVIRPRWKGYSEFMFWACFSYDRKGPCHIYTAETKKEKDEAAKETEALNLTLEPLKKQEWELNKGLERLGLRNKPGKKPQWRWNKSNGKLVRDGKGGIDWWRYQSNVLLPKLIPFAKECAEALPQKAPHNRVQTVLRYGDAAGKSFLNTKYKPGLSGYQFILRRLLS